MSNAKDGKAPPGKSPGFAFVEDAITRMGADAVNAFEEQAPRVLDAVGDLFEGIANVGFVNNKVQEAETVIEAGESLLPEQEPCPRCARMGRAPTCRFCRGTGILTAE